jgi:hypothetical protein
MFNHESDEAALGGPQRLQSIFEMLRQVPGLYKPPEIDGSLKVILGLEKRMTSSKSAESFTTIHLCEDIDSV